MNIRLLLGGIATLAMFVGIASSQTYPRKANLVGGGGPDRGKCTVEVVVDGAAEVEIRGDGGTIRNLGGQPPQWRRFECTSAMPPNAPNFRFTGVDGRGSQELVRAPMSGSGAVVRINDPQGGSEGYTFDLTWGDRMGPPTQGAYREGGYREGGNPQGRQGGDRRESNTPYSSVADSIRGCQDAVRHQVYERFHTGNVAFRRTNTEDNPGGRDVVKGIMDVRRGYDRDEVYRYSCTVNFESGIIRAVDFQPIDNGGYGARLDADRAPNRLALDNCQRAVEDKIRQNGYQHVDFFSVRLDDRPGRNGWVVGTARADIRMRSDSFSFSCNVELRDGDVRSVDVRPR